MLKTFPYLSIIFDPNSMILLKNMINFYVRAENKYNIIIIVIVKPKFRSEFWKPGRFEWFFFFIYQDSGHPPWNRDNPRHNCSTVNLINRWAVFPVSCSQCFQVPLAQYVETLSLRDFPTLTSTVTSCKPLKLVF